MHWQDAISKSCMGLASRKMKRPYKGRYRLVEIFKDQRGECWQWKGNIKCMIRPELYEGYMDWEPHGNSKKENIMGAKPEKVKIAKTDNDFWDLDEQDLSVDNLTKEIERMGEGDMVNLLNVKKEHLVFLTAAISCYAEFGPNQVEIIHKMNKMRDEVMDALNRITASSGGIPPSPGGQAISGQIGTSLGSGAYHGGGPATLLTSSTSPEDL